MTAIFFLALAAVFIWLLIKAHTTQEILAKGRFMQVRKYQRDNEPVRYWMTFWMYGVVAFTCLVVGIFLMLVPTHGA